MHEITDFLRGFPPFNAATDAALAEVELATEIEFFPAGTLVLKAGEGMSEHAFVVRAGQAELVADDRVVDVLDPGDLFGLPSMLTALPPGLDVRAAEDLLVYRIAEAAMLKLLSEKAGLRFLGETVRERSLAAQGDLVGVSASIHLRDLVRPAVLVSPSLTVREVASEMRARESSSAVIPDGEGFAIVTDNDLRNRVLAAGMSSEVVVSEVMTRGARTVHASMSADNAVLFVLSHAIRHLIVVEEDGSLLGIVEDVDLLAAQSRAPMRLRRAIAKAANIDVLAEICEGLKTAAASAHQSGQGADAAAETYSVLVESVISRVISLRLTATGPAPARFAWLVTGSLGRRELSPASDLDCLLAWDGLDGDPALRMWFRDFAAAVNDDLRRCGLRIDTHGVRADDPRFARSIAAWANAVAGWTTEPTEGQADIYLAALLDATAVYGEELWEPVRAALLRSVQSAEVKAVFARVATSHRPPTGFIKDLVIEASGEHRGELDLKGGGIVPIVDLARFYAAVLGERATSSLDRLAAARRASLLLEEDAADLREAWLHFTRLRFESQFKAMNEGREPDGYVAPAELPGLVRRRLKDALRVVARMQRELDASTAVRRF